MPNAEVCTSLGRGHFPPPTSQGRGPASPASRLPFLQGMHASLTGDGKGWEAGQPADKPATEGKEEDSARQQPVNTVPEEGLLTVHGPAGGQWKSGRHSPHVGCSLHGPTSPQRTLKCCLPQSHTRPVPKNCLETDPLAAKRGPRKII